MRTHLTHRAVIAASALCAALGARALAHQGHDEQGGTPSNDRARGEHRPDAPPQGHVQKTMERVALPEPSVSITIEGNARVIRANGLPGHETGAFPNIENPNALRPQSHEYRVPLSPSIRDEPVSARPEFGIGLNGVIFDAGTGEFWTSGRDQVHRAGSDWNYEALGGGAPFGLDMNNAHVQPTGKYHYHGVPVGLLDELGGPSGSERMIQIGWAFDGFPIYGQSGYDDAGDANSGVRALRSSYRLKEDERPARPDGPGGAYDGTFVNDWEYVAGLGDLDECNGRFGVTPEFPEGTYYYVVTSEFPSVPRLWRGAPDESMRRRGPDGPPRGRLDGGGADRQRGSRRE